MSSGVGKSALIRRFLTEPKKRVNEKQSVRYSEKNFRFGEELVRLQIWDTDPNDTEKSVVDYARSVDVVVVVYDVTDRQSFDHALTWLHEEEHLEKIHRFVIGNKCDLMKHRALSSDDARAELEGIDTVTGYFETSALDHESVT